jgi:hypothetical protein
MTERQPGLLNAMVAPVNIELLCDSPVMVTEQLVYSWQGSDARYVDRGCYFSFRRFSKHPESLKLGKTQIWRVCKLFMFLEGHTRSVMKHSIPFTHVIPTSFFESRNIPVLFSISISFHVPGQSFEER